ILIDPFLKDNPATRAPFKDLSRYKADAILVSHSHSDHSADAAELAKAGKAVVIGAYEWVQSLKLPEAQQGGGNVGGAFTNGGVGRQAILLSGCRRSDALRHLPWACQGSRRQGGIFGRLAAEYPCAGDAGPILEVVADQLRRTPAGEDQNAEYRRSVVAAES